MTDHFIKKSDNREDLDFYTTDPSSVIMFLDRIIKDGIYLPKLVLEPCCGLGDISEVLKEYGFEVISQDLVYRGYGTGGKDFLLEDKPHQCIFTNPPYSILQEFILKALSLTKRWLVLYVRLQFLEGKKKQEIFKKPGLRYIYLHVSRQKCYPQGKRPGKGQVAYCWLIWDKNYNGEPIFRWIENPTSKEGM